MYKLQNSRDQACFLITPPPLSLLSLEKDEAMRYIELTMSILVVMFLG